MVPGRQANLIFDFSGQSSCPASLCKPGSWVQHHTSTTTAPTDITHIAVVIIQWQVFLILEEFSFIVVCLAALLKITGVCGPV